VFFSRMFLKQFRANQVDSFFCLKSICLVHFFLWEKCKSNKNLMQQQQQSSVLFHFQNIVVHFSPCGRPFLKQSHAKSLAMNHSSKFRLQNMIKFLKSWNCERNLYNVI
jgi:hypothetical protein